MHIKCQYVDDRKEQIEFTITSENSREENELNLFWSLLSLRKMEDISKFLDVKNMTGLKFKFQNEQNSR